MPAPRTAPAAGRMWIEVDGRAVAVPAGSTVAAALLDLDVHAFRTSVTGKPRSPLCGMGICYECRLTIDDVPQQRACLVAVRQGMVVATSGGES